MEKIPSIEDTNSSASQEIICVLRNLKILYRVYNRPTGHAVLFL